MYTWFLQSCSLSLNLSPALQAHTHNWDSQEIRVSTWFVSPKLPLASGMTTTFPLLPNQRCSGHEPSYIFSPQQGTKFSNMWALEQRLPKFSRPTLLNTIIVTHTFISCVNGLVLSHNCLVNEIVKKLWKAAVVDWAPELNTLPTLRPKLSMESLMLNALIRSNQVPKLIRFS